MQKWLVFVALFLFAATLFAGWEKGANAYESIKARAKSAGVPYLVLVRADWCHWCQRFDTFLEDNAIDALFRDKLAVKVTPDHSEAEKKIAKDLGVRGYPSLFVILPNGSAQKLSLPLNKDTRTMLDALRSQLEAFYGKK